MAIDRKALLEEMNKAKAASGRVRFLKKNSTTTLRIVEYNDPESETGKSFWRKVGYHARAGNFGGKMDICRDVTFGQPCVHCLLNKIASENGEDQPFVTRIRYLVTAFDANEQRPRLAAWEFPTTVWEAIGGLLLTDDWQDLLDPKTGHAVAIRKEGAGLDTSYTVGPTRNPIPIPPDVMKTIKDPKDSMDDPGFEGQCRILGVDPSSFADVVQGSDTEDEPTEETLENDDPVEEVVEEETVEEEMIEEEIVEEKPIDMDSHVIYKGGEYVVSAINRTEGKCTIKNDKKRFVGVKLDALTLAPEPPWETDDAAVPDPAPEASSPKKLDPKKPVCFADPDFHDPTQNECKVCDQLKPCGEAIRTASGGSGSLPKTSKNSKKKQTTQGTPSSKPSASSILAGILGK
ncbi:MAG: hypothetical protein WC262_08605 [Bacteroidales bacterium]|jgi:hypothetical protein